MNYLIHEARQEVIKAVEDSFFDLGINLDSEVIVSIPKNKWGNLSTNACFILSKSLGKSPKETAELVASIIFKNISKKRYYFIEKVETIDGYLNFFLSQNFFKKALHQITVLKNFGSTEVGKGKKAVIEFSSPNVGKPLHVGHIRSTILGDSIERLIEFSGYTTVRINYLCDAGLQVAKLVLATEIMNLPTSKIKTEKDLLEYYIRINSEIENKPELKQKAQEILNQIESGNPTYLEKVKKISEISVKAFNKSYSILGVSFDEEPFESAFAEHSKKIVEEAISKGVAFKSEENAVVVKLEPELSNTIILRSNGTTLYLTRDMAFADYKYSKHRFDLSIYVTGAEQSLHFKQLFKIMELLGRPYARNCFHVPFGLLFIQGGRVSTREGRLILLEEVLQEAIEKAREELYSLQEKRQEKEEYTEKQVREITKKVGVGSLKFGVLRISPEKNISFDLRNAVRFEGDTGAYLQYTYVRARKIFEKAVQLKKRKKIKTCVKPYSFNEIEKSLIYQLSNFPIEVKNASSQFRPHILCDYLLDVAKSFSEFYEKCPVLKANENAFSARINIVKATKKVLKKGLFLLGIEAPEKM